MVWNMVDVEMNVERGPVDGEWRCSWLLVWKIWPDGCSRLEVENDGREMESRWWKWCGCSR